MFGILMFLGIVAIGFGKESYYGTPLEAIWVVFGSVCVVLAFGSLLNKKMRRLGKKFAIFGLGCWVLICIGTIWWLAVLPILGIICLREEDDQPKFYNNLREKVSKHLSKRM